MPSSERITKPSLLHRLILVVLLASSCQCAPSFNPKPSWRVGEEDNEPTILASQCNPTTGRCWGWLPILDSARLDSDYTLEQEPEYDKVQAIRVRDVEQASELWRDVPSAYVSASEAREHLLQQPAAAALPAAGRLSKKDVFMSRGWGAGGMPFSVLYMSPRANHPPPSGSSQADAGKSSGDQGRRSGSESSPSAAAQTNNQSNYRVALRNGNLGQPRRHYSIIPQLFISYGWGPSGK
ncbi:uncharacterized protein LOC107980717 [Nasonia vitripennis]|uniref:Uncharacterized protein n=1 Tax=Nasonia vitripennis TaxID=7425 RepID=A0A7M7M1R8_NASVI|nr:uncharacterized protein LOC107980717 [Nasonia vitripennis]